MSDLNQLQSVPNDVNMPEITCKSLTDKHIIFIIQSNIDRSMSREKVAVILEDCCKDQLPIHIDLSKVELMSSAFIGTLISFKKRYPDKQFFISNPNHIALEMLRINKLDKLFPIHFDKE